MKIKNKPNTTYKKSAEKLIADFKMVQGNIMNRLL